MAVFRVALIVSGVAEPLLDLSFGQVGDLHQPGDLGVSYKMIFQVAGFQFSQLLFGLFRPQAESVSAKSRVLLREEKQEQWVKREESPGAGYRSEEGRKKNCFLPVVKERGAGWWLHVSAHCLFGWAGWKLCWRSGTGWAALPLSK